MQTDSAYFIQVYADSVRRYAIVFSPVQVGEQHVCEQVWQLLAGDVIHVPTPNRLTTVRQLWIFEV